MQTRASRSYSVHGPPNQPSPTPVGGEPTAKPNKTIESSDDSNQLSSSIDEPNSCNNEMFDVKNVVSEPYQERGSPNNAARRRARSDASWTKYLYQDLLRLTPSSKEVSTNPPVTAATLAELEIGRIVFNIKLRHDINHDLNLHFRPNRDGEKGRRKNLEEERYWRCLLEELEDIRYSRWPQPNRERLPIMLGEILAILCSLVPELDRERIATVLDVDLRMAEIRKGTFDYLVLAQWLSKLLKAHCAPMRDQRVDEMLVQITYAVDNDSLPNLIVGLKTLFEILELMKLDVINHQIRNLRSLLIEDTPNYEQGYFLYKISRGDLDPLPAAEWFHDTTAVVNNWLQDAAINSCSHESKSTCDGGTQAYRDFVRCVCHSLTPGTQQDLPKTFVFDQDRLDIIRGEVTGEIYLQLCLEKFKFSLTGTDLPRDAVFRLEYKIQAVLGSCKERADSQNWEKNVEKIAVEILRMVNYYGSPDDSPLNPSQEDVDNFSQELLTDFQFQSKDSLGVSEEIGIALIRETEEKAVLYLSMDLYSVSKACFARVQHNPFDVNHGRDLSNIADRIAHICNLHWRVWSDIVYLRQLKDFDSAHKRDSTITKTRDKPDAPEYNNRESHAPKPDEFHNPGKATMLTAN